MTVCDVCRVRPPAVWAIHMDLVSRSSFNAHPWCDVCAMGSSLVLRSIDEAKCGDLVAIFDFHHGPPDI